MATRCARRKDRKDFIDTDVETLIERFKKMRALNCNDPYDVGLDGYVWKKFVIATRSHLVARMF